MENNAEKEAASVNGEVRANVTFAARHDTDTTRHDTNTGSASQSRTHEPSFTKFRALSYSIYQSEHF